MPEAVQRHLILLGLRGSGKSTCARALGESLKMPAVDLDHRTAYLLGAQSAGDAFRQHGAAAFRAAESSALVHVLGEPPRIIALGGGTPTAPGAADALALARQKGRAYVVFLDPPLDVLAARLSADAGDRPSLTGRGVVEEITEIAAMRRPLYAALADLVIDRFTVRGAETEPSVLTTGTRSLDDVVAEIVAGFRSAGSAA